MKGNVVIKDKIMGDINTTTSNIKTLDLLVWHTIANKDTLLGSKHEFWVVRMNIGQQAQPKTRSVA